MRNNSLFLFCVLCGIIKVVRCGNEPPNLFGLQLSSKPEPENPELSDNSGTSEDKSLEKRRLLFADGDMDGEIHSDKYSINGEYLSRRRSDQSQEEQQQLAGGERAFGGNQWDNRSKFSIPEAEHVGSTGGLRLQQPVTGPNLMYDWARSDVSEKTLSRWDEEKNFKQIINPRPDPPFGSPFGGAPFAGRNYPAANNGNAFDKRISITTLNDAEMRNSNRFNGDYRADEMRAGYQSHSNMDYQGRREDQVRSGYQSHADMDYQSRRDDEMRAGYQSHADMDYQSRRDRFWDQKFYRPEKGVIINLKTECPSPRQYSSQMVQRVIISPKSPVNGQSEASAYQYPGAFVSAAHHLSPPYYL